MEKFKLEKWQKNKIGMKEILVAIILMLITFILSMKSEVNIFTKGGTSTDGHVFGYIGYLMHNGFVPYRDVFDHKGMFLYFLNYIAIPLGKIRGVWILDVVFLFVAVLFFYKFARKFNGIAASFFVLFFVLARYSVCGSNGNHTEHYSLSFQILSMYFFFDYYDNQNSYIENFKFKLFDFRVCLLGICFSCVFFMKANLTALWIVFCIAIFVECIFYKHWIPLLRFVISFTAGFLIVASPILIYLIKNNAFKDFIEDYFIFNKKYSSGRGNIKNRVESFLYFLNTIPCVISVFILAVKIYKKDKLWKFCIINLCCIFFTILLITMAGDKWARMERSLLPCFIYPLSQIFILLKEDDSGNKKLTYVVMIALFIFFIIPSWSDLLKRTVSSIYSRNDLGFHNDTIVKYIRSNTKSVDTISVFGNRCSYYLYTERLPGSKYIFIPHPNRKAEPEIINEYISDLEQNKPKIIIISTEYKGNDKWAADKMNDFLKNNNYKLVIEKPHKVYEIQ